MSRSFRAGMAGLILLFALPVCLHAQPPGFVFGPYFDLPAGPIAVDPGPPVAAGWERLGDGIVGNEPAGAAAFQDRDRDGRPDGTRRRQGDPKASEPSNFDVRFVPRGWVVVWDRLVPLTDSSRDGSLYTLHPLTGGRVRVTLGERELFADVLFAPTYEDARTLLEGA